MEVDQSRLSPTQIDALARRIDRPVVLVGMMGTGKSTIGRRLASALHLPFVDSDEEIERAAQSTIAEIFDRDGEAFFRDGERRVIARLIASGTGVIATGGGAFCQGQTRALILERAIAVWLDSDIDTLLERVGRKDTRPLLREGNPREVLTRLRETRRAFYAQAPIHLMSSAGPQGWTVNKVLEAIDAWL